jgi:hypothetical protein
VLSRHGGLLQGDKSCVIDRSISLCFALRTRVFSLYMCGNKENPWLTPLPKH